MSNKECCIIVSGGMDSVTLLHDFRARIGLALSFRYGSRHNANEIPLAQEACRNLDIEHRVVDLSGIGGLLSSALLAGSAEDIPDGHYESPTMKKTVVPFRNGIMLAVAVGAAESANLRYVIFANHAGDHAIYPDCRPEFVDAISSAAMTGTYFGVRILSPYADLDKRAIALRGRELGVDFSRTWTCYKGGDVHCGMCGACTERREALEGFDPTKYSG